MLIPKTYKGREQALVKHRLLETYLQRLFMIIGLHQKNIRYVDCFSGPWQQGSKDLHDTSIGISLNIIRKCKAGLEGMGKRVSFHTLFIEKEKTAFQELQHHLAGIQEHDISTTAFQGDFFELRGSILQWCGPADFTFFFIDPKGWKTSLKLGLLRRFSGAPTPNF